MEIKAPDLEPTPLMINIPELLAKVPKLELVKENTRSNNRALILDPEAIKLDLTLIIELHLMKLKDIHLDKKPNKEKEVGALAQGLTA